ncbi:MAG: aminopeptidase [Oscillospiraceae bacterium]|jgi:aspartyl aminopeptidase|nr:aminopeptidase [Oscillospiraceae bacterium]
MSDNNLKRSLLNTKKNGHLLASPVDISAADNFNEQYKRFINIAKTERDAVREAVRLAEAEGFRPFSRGDKLSRGDKIYRINRGKSIVFAVIGGDLSQGANIAAAHIDSPRIDLKPNPLYEDKELAYFKTHYYGGIKKYHWVNIPLELRGAVALKDGSVIDISLGGAENEPVLVITDLLIHLSQEQMKKTLAEGITGEGLNALVGSIPFKGDDGGDLVKLSVMSILNEKYGIEEADLCSAELSLVPAMDARDVGLDRSLVGSYGHDDRVCSFDALRAIIDVEAPEKTAVCILADKEEIGSEGVSGMQSGFFDTFMEDICEVYGNVPLRVCYESSFCLSGDVTAAFDPNFAQPYEALNSAKLNYGVGICKYTGSRGKSGASDASAELVAKVRRIFDEAGVLWQICELGAVDAGGGGTVAMYMANRNIDTLDAGVPVLSMHSPYEIVSKLDNFMTYKGILAIFKNA